MDLPLNTKMGTGATVDDELYTYQDDGQIVHNYNHIYPGRMIFVMH